jgi:hypothetical protein
MRRQGVALDDAEMGCLAELIQKFDDLPAEFTPKVERTHEQLAGCAPWIQVDQLIAYDQFELLQSGIPDQIEREDSRYWGPVRRVP